MRDIKEAEFIVHAVTTSPAIVSVGSGVPGSK
jgi:hypothetical protein